MKVDFKKNIHIVLFFAAFMFLQFVTLRMGNQAGRGFLSNAQQENVYIFLQGFVIGGIILHIVLSIALKSDRISSILSAAALAVCGSCSGYMLFAPVDSAIYLIVTFIAVFCLGIVVGKVYDTMSKYSASGFHIGVCMGIGYSAALLLQFLLQLQWFIQPAIAVFYLASMAVLGMQLLRRAPDGETSNEQADRIMPGKIVSACVITGALLLFTAFYCGYIHHLQIASGYTEFNVYTWPRLLMIPGMLMFGVIGDYKKGKYLPLVTLCFSLIAFLNVVLTGQADAYWLNMSLYYIALSAAVSYYNVTFWKLAAGTKKPALWSVAGRILDSVVVIPLCIAPLTGASTGVVLSLNIAALVVIIVLMALNGDFDFSEKPDIIEKLPDEPPSEDDMLASIAERYGLTPAEIRVFRLLVLTEDKQAAIAEKLSVKLRTVQANVTSIYRKTGATTRSGLLQIYHDSQK